MWCCIMTTENPMSSLYDFQRFQYIVPKEFHYGLRNALKCFEILKPHINFKKINKKKYIGFKNWNKIINPKEGYIMLNF